MNTRAIILQTHNLSKFFYTPVKFQALHNIDLLVYKGEFLSLMGKSGSGKSTLLYCLSTRFEQMQSQHWKNNANTAFINATNARRIAFNPVKPLATRLVNALEATDASNELIKMRKP